MDCCYFGLTSVHKCDRLWQKQAEVANDNRAEISWNNHSGVQFAIVVCFVIDHINRMLYYMKRVFHAQGWGPSLGWTRTPLCSSCMHFHLAEQCLLVDRTLDLEWLHSLPRTPSHAFPSHLKKVLIWPCWVWEHLRVFHLKRCYTNLTMNGCIHIHIRQHFPNCGPRTPRGQWGTHRRGSAGNYYFLVEIREQMCKLLYSVISKNLLLKSL